MSESPSKSEINIPLKDLNAFWPGSVSVFAQFLLSPRPC